MRIFQDIKNGIIPEDEVVLQVISGEVTLQNDPDEAAEIQHYKEILSKSFQNVSSLEKMLIAKILFFLYALDDKEKAISVYFDHLFTIYIHDLEEEHAAFYRSVIDAVGVEDVIRYFENRFQNLQELPKKELRTLFNWFLHVVWNAEKFINTLEVKRLYEPLKSFIYYLIKTDRIDEMMYVEFVLYHIMGNSYHTADEWRVFQNEITVKTAQAYKRFVPQLPKPKNRQKEKKRIAFIKDRLAKNSPFKVEYSLLHSLMQDKEFTDDYEVLVYSFEQFEKQSDRQDIYNQIKKLGIEVKRPVAHFKDEGYYHSHLEKALKMRKTLIEDEIDIMVGCVGMYPIMNFLFTTRSANKQIYYSHGNCVYDVEGIDKRVSHFKQECDEFDFEIIDVPIAKEFLVGSEEEKQKGLALKEELKSKYGKDTVFLGTIGRLVKVDHIEYLQTVAKIMEQNKHTIYLACGLGNTESIKQKLKQVGIDEKRFLFPGEVNAHAYGWVIDVWLETFPLRQGQSQLEFVTKGHGFVVNADQVVNETMVK